MSEEIDYFKDENFVLDWRQKLDFDIFTGNYFYEKNFPINFSKLIKVTIKNFKSIKEQTIDLEDLTFITGYNSSGKSTISHFIVMILQWIAGISKSEISTDLNINGPMIKLGEFNEIKNRNKSESEDIEIILNFKTNIGYQNIHLILQQSSDEKGRFRLKVKDFSKNLVIEKKDFYKLSTLQPTFMNKKNLLTWENNFSIFINKLLDPRVKGMIRKNFFNKDLGTDFIDSNPEKIIISYKLTSQKIYDKEIIENRMLLGNTFSRFYLEDDFAEQNFPENIVLDSHLINKEIPSLTTEIQIIDINEKVLDTFFSYLLFPKAYLSSKKNINLPSGLVNNSYFKKPYTNENSVIISGKNLLKYRIVSELKLLTSGVRNDIDTFNSFRALIPLDVLAIYNRKKDSLVGETKYYNKNGYELYISYLNKFIKNYADSLNSKDEEVEYLKSIFNFETYKKLNKNPIESISNILKMENNFSQSVYKNIIEIFQNEILNDENVSEILNTEKKIWGLYDEDLKFYPQFSFPLYSESLVGFLNSTESKVYSSDSFVKNNNIEGFVNNRIETIQETIENILFDNTKFNREEIEKDKTNAIKELKQKAKESQVSKDLLSEILALENELKIRKIQNKDIKKYFKNYKQILNVREKRIIDGRFLEVEHFGYRLYDKLNKPDNSKDLILEEDDNQKVKQLKKILHEVDVINLVNFNTFVQSFQDNTNLKIDQNREFLNNFMSRGYFKNSLKIKDFITTSNDDILNNFNFELNTPKEIEEYYKEKSDSSPDYVEALEITLKELDHWKSQKKLAIEKSKKYLGINVEKESLEAHDKKFNTYLSLLEVLRERDVINQKSNKVYQQFKCTECNMYHLTDNDEKLKSVQKIDTNFIEEITKEIRAINLKIEEIGLIQSNKNFKAFFGIEEFERSINTLYMETPLYSESNLKMRKKMLDQKYIAFLNSVLEFKKVLPILLEVIDNEVDTLWEKSIKKNEIHVKNFGYVTNEKTFTDLISQTLEGIIYKIIYHKSLKRDPLLIWKLFKMFNIFVEDDDSVQFDNFLYGESSKLSSTKSKLIKNIQLLNEFEHDYSISHEKQLNLHTTFSKNDYVIAKFKNNIESFEMIDETLTDNIKILRIDNDKENVRNETFTPNTPVGIFGDMTNYVLTENKNIKFINPLYSINTKTEGDQLNHKKMIIQENFEDSLQQFTRSWMNYILNLDIKLSISQESKNDVDIKINDDYLHNVGSGVRKVLQVVTAVLTSQGNTLFLEEIEQNLHASAQARILDLLLYSSIKNNSSFVVETHSDHLINRLRLRKAEFSQQLNQDVKWKVYFAKLNKNNETEFIDLKINNKGMFENEEIPKGFFDQPQNDIVSLLNIQSKNS